VEREAGGFDWPEWMSVDTAARYLDASEERVRKLKDRKEIPHYQEGPGCRVFFRRSELDHWMNGFRRAAAH
jgi:excisionase family DNA binding protein